MFVCGCRKTNPADGPERTLRPDAQTLPKVIFVFFDTRLGVESIARSFSSLKLQAMMRIRYDVTVKKTVQRTMTEQLVLNAERNAQR